MSNALPYKSAPSGNTPLTWDIFCRVIDNFGDVGVCWRLSAQLARRGYSVRLWIDDAASLSWMAPNHQLTHPQVQVLAWQSSAQSMAGDVVIEAFGCEIDANFLARRVERDSRGVNQGSVRFPVWLNLEYLSAQSFAMRCHGLPSPVMSGPCKGMTKWFYYPGFTPQSGGLLREDLLDRYLDGDARQEAATRLGLTRKTADEVLVSLFCYEPPALTAWLQSMAEGRAFVTASTTLPSTRLFVASGRPTKAVRSALKAAFPEHAIHKSDASSNSFQHRLLSVEYLPYLSQERFDDVLRASDFNCVRGEDSLVRGLWAGKPLLWHIYPQDDGAHFAKLSAWLLALEATPTIAAAHQTWNASEAQGALPRIELDEWQGWMTAQSAKLMKQTSLLDRLITFVEDKRDGKNMPQ